MAKTITAANAIIIFSVAGLQVSTAQLQGFSADDIFTTEDQQRIEALMGVDGKLSGGKVNNPVVQNYALQADSDSNDFFDDWNLAEVVAEDVYYANALVTLISIGKQWTCTKGVLSRFKPLPDAAKVLQPRRYTVTWEKVVPQNI